jgi:hypothetical protein
MVSAVAFLLARGLIRDSRGKIKKTYKANKYFGGNVPFLPAQHAEARNL